MLIKLLTEARNGRENSNAKCDKYGGQRPEGPLQRSAGPRQLQPEDGYLQLVYILRRRYVYLFVCLLPMAISMRAV